MINEIIYLHYLIYIYSTKFKVVVSRLMAFDEEESD